MLKTLILIIFGFALALINATTTNFTIFEYKNNIQKALARLISHREQNWGWGEYTAKALLAIQLAPLKDLKPVLLNQAEVEKSTRILEAETALLFEEAHVNVLKLAQNSLTLIAFCQNLTEFHGHNIFSELRHHAGLSGIELAYAGLVECSAGTYITNHRIQQLLNIIDNSRLHDLETLALTVLSLRCISQDKRHNHLQYSLNRSIADLARQQQADGDFGNLHDTTFRNLHNTALIIWALQNTSETNWNKSSAMSFLKSKQHQVHSGLMCDVILALSSVLPWSLQRLNCKKNDDDTGELVDPNYLFHIDNSKNVSITYTLWIGSDVVENYTLELTVPRSLSFYEVMQSAMERDPKFTFEASIWSYGHYIHSLGGRSEDRVEGIYWLLYRTPEVPDPDMVASSHFVASAVGVDGLLAEEGDHYLFWYKKL